MQKYITLSAMTFHETHFPVLFGLAQVFFPLSPRLSVNPNPKLEKKIKTPITPDRN
jgi:hypothetical protein